MHLVIISGRSGSGKSTALHVLEDAGFTCIDNLPLELLKHLIRDNPQQDKRFAISLDARTPSNQLEDFEIFYQAHIKKSPHVRCQILFLDANEDVLIHRFSETRRKHPLTSTDVDLRSAITQERLLLSPIADEATYSFDTSEFTIHELKEHVFQWLGDFVKSNEMTLQFLSFGFKKGIPSDADVLFDVRCLPNPHWDKFLRPLTGLDNAVVDYLNQQPLVEDMFQDIKRFLERWLPQYTINQRRYMTVAVGCTGGKHRSVYLSQRLSEYFSEGDWNILVTHRDMPSSATDATADALTPATQSPTSQDHKLVAN